MTRPGVCGATCVAQGALGASKRHAGFTVGVGAIMEQTGVRLEERS